MSIDRRHFLRLDSPGRRHCRIGTPSGVPAFSTGSAAKTLRILILGGTGFTGPFQVRYALSRGHQITVFNRGRTHPGELPKEVEQLIGDRNGKLDALKGRTWDVVIDNPTTLPVWVRDAAEILKGNVDRYVFISTISVYADTSRQGMNETAPLTKYTGADPMKETSTSMRANNFALYGPLKAASEAEAENGFRERRWPFVPGISSGPATSLIGLLTGRFALNEAVKCWRRELPPTRFRSIDARDLAEWTIRMVEQGTAGPFNAVGPKSRLAMGRSTLDANQERQQSLMRGLSGYDILLTSEKVIDEIPDLGLRTNGTEAGYSTGEYQ